MKTDSLSSTPPKSYHQHLLSPIPPLANLWFLIIPTFSSTELNWIPSEFSSAFPDSRWKYRYLPLVILFSKVKYDFAYSALHEIATVLWDSAERTLQMVKNAFPSHIHCLQQNVFHFFPRMQLKQQKTEESSSERKKNDAGDCFTFYFPLNSNSI